LRRTYANSPAVANHELRVGDWRVILQLDPTARRIVICRVLPRGRAYDR
jgi:mRNA-degrading endonuclease RelE of RelBE toxin-antitoxin system